MHDINPVFDVGSGAATLRDTQVMKYEAVKATDCALSLKELLKIAQPHY